MVHGLRGHQAVLLPVHHPQVRGWASLTTPSPLDLSVQSPAPGSRWRDPSSQSSVSRAGPEPDAGGKAGQTWSLPSGHSQAGGGGGWCARNRHGQAALRGVNVVKKTGML